ncbi:GNAT family N-acetyltransferase [Sphingomonas sanxanigenens]|uniref:N-acetyltransferase domain-containing protein n=1 Tax=Sphingomonas sanxanigenens DSM 19645 = NX02 TaxID=1123269 RepID=W0AHA5_9SPHN|nr:N-acetyltransferase [Sphingomonas sanxanigenens]AHE57299.1 hypothetical protein NX02_28600 [Sphingomonas sanxanigenens DSM 19645 = NX02]
MVKITPLSDADPSAVEALLDDAFGADRRGRTAYRMREGTQAIDALCFGAFDGGRLVGTIQCWPVSLLTPLGAQPMVMVGPVAVEPDRQRDGIGRALVAASLAASDARGGDVLMMIGDPEYYGRFFGFSADGTALWEVPGPVERHRLLARVPDGTVMAAAGRIAPRVHA